MYVNISGIQVAIVSADAAGDFSTDATVPALANGDHNVFASNFAADCEVSATFAVTDPPPPPPDDCSISASPSVAATGQQITLAGDQWGPERQIYVDLGGIQIAGLTASSRGASGNATVPTLPDGPQLLLALDGPAECEVSSSVETGAKATTTSEPDETTTTDTPQPDDGAPGFGLPHPARPRRRRHPDRVPARSAPERPADETPSTGPRRDLDSS